MLGSYPKVRMGFSELFLCGRVQFSTGKAGWCRGPEPSRGLAPLGTRFSLGCVKITENI